MKLNSFRIKLGNISTNHFYLQKPCVQQETAQLWRLLLCFRSGKAGAARLSSVWHTVTQNQGSNQIQVMHFTSPCYTHFVGRDFPGRVQLHRRRAGGAPLIISLTLWTEEHKLILTKGVCITGCSPILLLNSICYKMSFFPQYVSLATESQSVESSHGYCAVN